MKPGMTMPVLSGARLSGSFGRRNCRAASAPQALYGSQTKRTPWPGVPQLLESGRNAVPGREKKAALSIHHALSGGAQEDLRRIGRSKHRGLLSFEQLRPKSPVGLSSP